jgi:GntR family transcriptional regulator
VSTTGRTLSLRAPSTPDARRESSDVSDRDSASPPLWQQVLTDLERRIVAGDISGRFPTDKELTEQYGVSRHTVREAVRRLRARGLVERHRGRGSFINDPQLAQPLGGIYSLFRAVEERGLEQRSEVLALDTRRDPDAATRLGLPPRSELVRLDRLRYADDQPLALDSVWLPADVGRPLLDVDFTRTALYDELRDRVGVAITAVDETLEPVVPDDELRELLELDDDEALFRVRRLGRSGDRPIECRLTLIRGRRFVYTSSWRGAGQPPAASAAADSRWVTTS